MPDGRKRPRRRGVTFANLDPRREATMNRTTAFYLGAIASLITVLALVRPTMPPRPPAKEPEQVGVVPADPGMDLLGLRSAAQRRLVADVIDGRRSVFAAAALF